MLQDDINKELEHWYHNLVHVLKDIDGERVSVPTWGKWNDRFMFPATSTVQKLMYELQIAYRLYDGTTDAAAKTLLNLKATTPHGIIAGDGGMKDLYTGLDIAEHHQDLFNEGGQTYLDRRAAV